MDALI